MKNKPLYLVLFPLLSLGIAVSFPLQIHLLYDIPLSDPEKIFSMLTPLNIVSMATLVLAAGLTTFLSRWIYKVVPFLLLVLLSNNAIVGLYGTDYTLAQVALSFVLFGLSLKPFYKKEIKAVIMNPRLRWWTTPKRYDMKQNLEIKNENFKATSQSLNLSSAGVFIKINDQELLGKIAVNDIINVTIDNIQPIELQAKVMRVTKSHPQQPDGIGLEFIFDEKHKNEYLPWFKQNVSEISL